jgi:dTDP-4-amino-4,6-dideoxygalactose transaminase
MNHITAWTDLRIGLAAKYTEALKDCTSFKLPYVTPGFRHVFHLYALEVNCSCKRDAFVAFLQENGIDAKTHYSIAIHQQEGFPWGKDCRIDGSLENAENNAATCVSIPLFPELQADEQAYVIEKVLEWDKANA